MAAVVPSCGGTSECGPDNCTGCCDASNKCVPASASNSNSACGKGGATCSDCVAKNQVCEQTTFVCVPGGTTTGGGSGTTGGGDGTTGGGSGTTGGGTGTTGGGTGTTGGGTGTTACNVASQTCTGAGEQCMPTTADLNGICVSAACNTRTQDCPNNQACVIGPTSSDISTLTRQCVPAGTKLRGEACNEQMVECAKGLQCFQGQCQKFCNQDTDCDTGGSCAFFVGYQNAPFGSFVCFHAMACDPLAQNCAAQTDACLLLPSGPGCAPFGTTALGQPCTSANQCVKGAQCLQDQTGMGSCRSFCNLDAGMPSCASGTCNPLQNQQGMPVGFGGCF